MEGNREYYARLAAAYVRGRLSQHVTVLEQSYPLFCGEFGELGEEAWQRLIRYGLARGVRLHQFKQTMGLPRVRRVLGILRGIGPANLLDVGSGRGVFLWPLLDSLPHLPVTSIDLLDHRVAAIRAVQEGGVSHLTALRADVTDLPFADRSFDVVTVLEVLEHVPDPKRTLAEVCRVSGRFVVLSCPSREDDNPEHLHLFDRQRIERLLAQSRARRIQVDYVRNHMVVVARVG